MSTPRTLSFAILIALSFGVFAPPAIADRVACFPAIGSIELDGGTEINYGDPYGRLLAHSYDLRFRFSAEHYDQGPHQTILDNTDFSTTLGVTSGTRIVWTGEGLDVRIIGSYPGGLITGLQLSSGPLSEQAHAVRLRVRVTPGGVVASLRIDGDLVDYAEAPGVFLPPSPGALVIGHHSENDAGGVHFKGRISRFGFSCPAR